MYGDYELNRDNDQYPAIWSVKNNWCLPHFHSSVEIVYVTEGTLKATINNRFYTVQKGQVLVSSSYMVHNYSTDCFSDSIVLIVPLDFVPSYKGVLAQKVFSQCVYDAKSDNGEFLHCMQRILSSMDAGCGNSNIVKGYVYVILGILIEQVGLTEICEDESCDLTKNILVFLQNNYRNQISLKTLAQTFGYSKSRFSHIFNARFGCGMSEYIDMLRCRHAADMISNSAPLVDAALDSGFESIRTFYRCFKRCYGTTPSNYRDSLN